MSQAINYQVGDVVEHLQTKEVYFVVEIDWQNQITKCRTKSHEVFTFSSSELTIR